MCTVRVAARVRSEGRDAFLAQLEREEREVPHLFAGCERFTVYSDPADPDNQLLYEEWTSREAADAYLSSDHLRAGGSVLVSLMDRAPNSPYYESVRVGP
jgi:quinol monooxygenase YgiN